mgnify:CR=1 FL=1
MKQFYLAEITTKDKLLHQGIYFEPKKKGKKAIFWVHGLSGTFDGDLALHEAFSYACEKEGWGYAAFHNRGRNLIAGIRKLDGTPPKGHSYFLAGAGQEVFTESVFDIQAGVDFLVKQGFKEIILIGHSTGANKVCYFAATQKNPHVVGAVLAGPMSDRLDTTLQKEKVKKDIARMRDLIAQGKGDQLLLGYNFFPITPKRFLSLFEPGSTEDVFDYGDKKPKLRYFSKIRLPLMVLLAGDDEYADRPMKDIQKVFDTHAKSKQYKSMIIPGALHKFNGKEKEAIQAILDWLKSLNLQYRQY